MQQQLEKNLLAYNTVILAVRPSVFSPTAQTPRWIIRTLRFSGVNDLTLSDAVIDYLAYLDLASSATEDSFLDDFVAETLKLLHFNEHNKAVWVESPQVTRGMIKREVTGQTNVWDLHRPTLIQPLVKNETLFYGTDSDVQVVAGAIASF